MRHHEGIATSEEFVGAKVILRLVTLADCTDAYVAWLNDGNVNRYLETRWVEQTRTSVEGFVRSMLEDEDNYLFAILERDTRDHVGNIKLGPINWRHGFSEVSYFVGDTRVWGRGLATDALRVVAGLAFKRFSLRRLQAGLYEGNRASAAALCKVGFQLEGRFRDQLRTPAGWESGLWYGLLRDEWNAL